MSPLPTANELEFARRVRLANGTLVTNVDARLDNRLPDFVNYYLFFDLQWQISLDNGRKWITPNVANTSSNTLYVTFANPLINNIRETYLGAAYFGNVLGQNTKNEVVNEIFNGFASLIISRVDNTRLRYYGNWNAPVTSLQLLQSGNGTCDAWGEFFLNVLWAQGIREGQRTGLWTKNSREYFLVKNWTFGAANWTALLPAKMPANHPWRAFTHYNLAGPNDTLPYRQYFLAGSRAQNDYVWGNLVPPGVTHPHGAGVPGQNNNNPLSIFYGHCIVRFGGTTVGYDPSYGITYSSSLWDVEEKAIDGYAVEVRMNEGEWTDHYRKTGYLQADQIFDPNKNGVIDPEIYYIFVFRPKNINVLGLSLRP